jgi:hypothetical protein
VVKIMNWISFLRYFYQAPLPVDYKY